MCLIIASSSGKRIPDNVLEDANRTNSHGAGIAWFDASLKSEKKIQFRKGLSLLEVKKIMDEDIKGAPHVVHFRIATIGGQLPELTHPFTVDEDASVEKSGIAGSVLFHNGTYSSWKDNLLLAAASSGCPLPEAPWSDSRAVAFMCHVYGKHILSILDNGSRYLVFDGAEPATRQMLLWGDWHTKDEFKYSNRSASVFDYRQGGATNFQNRGVGNGPNETNAAGTESDSEIGGNETPATRSSSSSRTTTAKSRRVLKVRTGYKPWKMFSETGDKQIVGENETKRSVAM